MTKSDEDVREELRRRLLAPPLPPLEAARKFVRIYCADNSLAEAEAMIGSMARQNTSTLRSGLSGIESLLASPPAEPNALRDLIVLDAMWPLDEDNSDEGAKVVLQELAAIVRKHLAAVGVEVPSPR